MTGKPHRTYYLKTRHLLVQGLGSTVATLVVTLVVLDAPRGLAAHKQAVDARGSSAQDTATKAQVVNVKKPAATPALQGTSALAAWTR